MCPKSIFAVYGPSSIKFGMKVAHRTLITGKILGSSYLGNRFYGNQKTTSELTKCPKGCEILSGGTLDGKRIVCHLIHIAQFSAVSVGDHIDKTLGEGQGASIIYPSVVITSNPDCN